MAKLQKYTFHYVNKKTKKIHMFDVETRLGEVGESLDRIGLRKLNYERIKQEKAKANLKIHNYKEFYDVTIEESKIN